MGEKRVRRCGGSLQDGRSGSRLPGSSAQTKWPAAAMRTSTSVIRNASKLLMPIAQPTIQMTRPAMRVRNRPMGGAAYNARLDRAIIRGWRGAGSPDLGCQPGGEVGDERARRGGRVVARLG